MGNISQAVPSIHPIISITEEKITAHSAEFAVASASEKGFGAIIRASKALAMTAIDLLTTPGHLVNMKGEFSNSC